MNERIKAFALKAGFKEDFMGVYAPVVDGAPLDDELMEFAKLIIRQCADIADDNYNKGAWPVGGYVLDHFGVER